MIKKERLELTKVARKGFTLIEILIVVAIIAILASVVLVGLGPTQQAGRDSRRLSDLSEVQNGLELYYNKCGYYPGNAEPNTPCAGPAADNTWGVGGANPTGMSAALMGSNIGVTNVPDDPSSPARTYLYGASADGSAYVVSADLENPNNAVFTGYVPPDVTTLGGGIVGVDASNCVQPNYCKTL